MSKPILFVCQSCRATHTDSPDRPSEGMILLKQLLELSRLNSQLSELEIQPVGCLWTCDRPCAIALSSSHKSTYMLANIPIAENLEETAEAILRLCQLYLESQDGNIPWKKFPDVLQTDTVARIPPLIPSVANEA